MWTPVGIGAAVTALLLCLPIGRGGIVASAHAQYLVPEKVPAAPKAAAPSEPAAQKERPLSRRRPSAPEGAGGSVTDDGASSGQCAWLGRRIIGLLVRDDAMAANDFIPFYQRFGCAEDHLARSFGCVVSTIGVIENNAIADQIEDCWNDPTAQPAPPAAAAPAETEKKPAAGEVKPEKKPAPAETRPAEPGLKPN